MRHPAFAAIMLGVMALAGHAVDVPVIVTEPSGLDRPGEPVSGGIPLPAGQFKPDAPFALFDGRTPIPVQASPLVTGPDGSLRWVLLDYQIDLKAGQTRTLTLRPGKPAAPAHPLKTTQTPEQLTVDTGRLAFAIRKNEPFSLSQCEAIRGVSVRYADAVSRKTYPAGPPETLRFIYSGPLRVTIEARGRFAGDEEHKLRYATFITAWAGRSDILVRHTLINSREDMRDHVNIGASIIEIQPAGPSKEATVAAASPQRHAAPLLLHQGLQSSVANAVKLTQGDRTLWAGQSAGGWVSSGGIWVFDRMFSADPPRSMALTGEGVIVLDSSPRRFDGVRQGDRIRGQPFESEHRWLLDCSHHSSEYRIDLAAPADPAALSRQATTAAARVWGFAPGRWVSDCDVLAVGKFGTLEDEKAAHARWGWTATKEPAAPKPNPTRFVAWEDNHYESEADSPEGLLLMFLRTGQRGYFDEAEAWCRYHADLQTWRTEGWAWKDGAIWFPQGGPLGNRPQRAKADKMGFVPSWNKAATARDRDLWRTVVAKECYCHYYGAGLVDWYCLTGDTDALDAAIDKCEMKLDEFTRSRSFTPGKSGIACTRGFGRGFYVAVRTWMARPQDPMLQKLIGLCRDTLVQLPAEYMDERAVYAPIQKSNPSKYLTDGIKRKMDEAGITADKTGMFRDSAGKTWNWRDIGGTWMISYIDYAAEMLARQTGDEDLMDYVIATGEFTAKHLLSPAGKQTWYYTALDIPAKGVIWDPWLYDGLQRNDEGEGPKHDGYYTRFFPDVMAQAYALSGQRELLDAAQRFWFYGNRRGYQTTTMSKEHRFADHRPPKDDTVLSTVRLFHTATHPRTDTQPPAAITDLSVELQSDGRATVRFTAPLDAGGKVARYQVKAAALPIVPYDQWDSARDERLKRNWWRAANLSGEPAPATPGTKERFTVTSLPAGKPLYFAVVSFDDSSNRSAISNVVKAE